MEACGNNSCLHFSVHSRDQFNISTLIEDPHAVAVRNTPCLRIDGRNLQQSRFFHFLQRWQVGECRIEKIVRLPRQQLQRQSISLGMSRFRGRSELHHRIQPLRFQRFTVKLRLPRGSTKPSASKRKKRWKWIRRWVPHVSPILRDVGVSRVQPYPVVRGARMIRIRARFVSGHAFMRAIEVVIHPAFRRWF
jgi:hypothetical protein